MPHLENNLKGGRDGSVSGSTKAVSTMSIKLVKSEFLSCMIRKQGAESIWYGIMLMHYNLVFLL